MRHPLPHTYLLRGLAPPARALLRGRYQVEILNADSFPAHGPVIVAANHMGWLDGPMMAIFAPRPLHALTKSEMFEGSMGRLLVQAGQIPVTREIADVRAVRTALGVLRDGGVVGIFPESRRGDGAMHVAKGGAAYLAMVSGAPILPLAFLGTRAAGADVSSVPTRGARLVMSYGQPLRVPQAPWPRTRLAVRETTEQVRLLLREHVGTTIASTGMELPGMPPGGPQ